ncbi:BspA family leucine-rich repeat surface protein [Limosilactobacillus vaginalis]|uniref:BspA family leucine-rich repeat surface protein n=1 Tax=Limosilactobacillus vaginalis TaxID=1633 RepID=UPI0024BB11D1|nr:BspA family leucine-rich repeat surface protein [Limosilactobacillus vaginalis]
MPKEHKKLYKAGKNWIVATLTATTITLLGGIGAYTVHADTTIESSQDVQTTSVNQTNQVNNTNNSVTLNNNQPVAVQSSQTAQNDQSGKGNQTNQIVPSFATAAADTSNSDGLDSNIYGTVNVKDWDYQNDSNAFSLTSYHGQDTRHIIVPNLNDFDNAGVKIGNATGIGISSKLAKSLAHQSIAFAISKTSGKYSDKVIATTNDWLSDKAIATANDWSFVFSYTDLVNADLSNLDTRSITNMGWLFCDNTGLKTVGNLSHWDTSNVRDMSYMFAGYNGVIGDLSHWNVSNVKNMSYMFSTSSASVSGLNTWNIRQTTYMPDMFLDSSLPYEVVTSNAESIVPNQVTLKDNTGKVLAIIDTPTIYDSNKSVRSTIDGIVQAEIDKLNKLNHTSYETPEIISGGYDDYSIANATYVVNNESQSKTGLINYVDQDGKVVKTDQVSGKVGDKVDVKLSLPDGYELANKDEQVPSTITVGDDGIKTININIKKIPVIKTGTINYIDPDGKVVKTDQVSGKVGDKVDVKLSLPDGYELANKDEQVPSTITVGDDGIKTIIINIKKIPITKTGTINYIDPDGKVVKTDQVSGKVGDKVDVKLSLPDGYELANKDEQIPSTVTVTEDGISPISVNIKKINTTLADNEVPYDSTTVSNNENANYGYLDSYKLTENNQGQAQLIASGWHATGASNSDRYRYMIVFDNTLGHEIARQKLVPQVRSDVQRAYSNVDNSLYSGFNITIDIPNSSINHSLSLIARYSNDPNNGEGARVDYWFNPLALNEGNQAYLDGLSSNGNTLTVTGWHATNQAAGRPYHYIIAWDQNLGHEIARQKVTAVSRPDVANAYSTVANAVNSGFSVKFNLTPQFFNDNIQFISRWTDDAAGNGNAVDYWFKPMNRTNRANLDSVTLSNGQLQVAGWHATDLSQLEPNHYLIVFDNTTGQQVASEKVGLQSSQDVKNVFGDVQTANHSRFNYTFNSLHLISGHNYSLVSRYSADANGNGNDGAHTDSWLNMGTFQQSAYSIDHVALNRRHMTVQGWVANDNAMTRPYAYAILLQNGHEIGRQRLNLSERADVAKVYPQIYRSQYSGFNTSFDLPTASTNGLQLVLRFTDDPAGNGNSSDKWINL